MTFEEELELHGGFVFTNKGTSMWPLIRPGRDLIEISARQAPLKKYDVALFKSDGRYILHRIIRLHSGAYDLLGDNNIRMERGVKDEQIIGVMSAVIRDGKRRLDVNAAAYRLYVALWGGLYPIRTALLRLAAIAKSIIHKILPRRRG